MKKIIFKFLLISCLIYTNQVYAAPVGTLAIGTPNTSSANAANAANVHGALGELIVRNSGQNNVQVIVRFDNNYRGVCGSSEFRLTRTDWNDIDMLAKAVSSRRAVDFGYECSGNVNRVTRFNWWKG